MRISQRDFRLLWLCLLFASTVPVLAAAPAAPMVTMGTGLFAAGSSLADGSADPNFTLSSTLDPAIGPRAFVAQASPFPAAWVPDSQWFSPQANGSLAQVSGIYDYTVSFELSGYNASATALDLVFAADDTTNLLLNGNTVASHLGGYQALTNNRITSGFLPAVVRSALLGDRMFQ